MNLAPELEILHPPGAKIRGAEGYDHRIACRNDGDFVGIIDVHLGKLALAKRVEHSAINRHFFQVAVAIPASKSI